jgi:diaminopimelate decarboxylase
VPTAHPSGWAHADGALRANRPGGPHWLREPSDPDALVTSLWSQTATKDDGVLSVGGVPLTELVREHGSPAYVLDEADFRSRARAFRDAFAGYDVFYAGKAFLCTTVVRWLAEEGLSLDVCSGGELAVAERAGFPMDRVGFHGNNKTVAELERAVELGVGRVIVDSFHEIERLAELTRPLVEEGLSGPSRDPVGVMVRVTAGVEAHTHEYIATAHEDQKFGFSIASGDALEAVRRVHAAPGLRLLGLHSHIGSQIFDTSGFEVAARRVLALHAQVSEEVGVEMPEMDLGGGFGIAYTTQDDPSDPAQLATEITKIVEHECRALGVAHPRLSIEPGRAIVGPSMCTVYEVGTVKEVALDGGARRTYVSVDGGMSDNIRTALYDADYSATIASRPSGSTPVLARVVGKHCEAGDIVVKDEFLPGDVRPGDLVAVPGTGAYCRSMASNYNHALRPPVIGVRDGKTFTVLRRETEADLFATDVGVL